mmetsp:Transcript_14357/g.20029  ORF Transcript_14357/g.20029 Transcript_14357/m.20029 type:complete len:251 (-) Transcript_14357:68-820(-)
MLARIPTSSVKSNQKLCTSSTIIRAQSKTSLSQNSTNQSTQQRTLINVPKLAYDLDKGVAPLMSPRVLKMHYEEHYMGHVKRLNQLIKGTEFDTHHLTSIVRKSYEDATHAAIHNQAGAAFAHRLFFRNIVPEGRLPSAEVLEAISTNFGDFKTLAANFYLHAKSLHGNGYVWLVSDKGGALDIMTTSNSVAPFNIRQDVYPVLVLDMWEHSYYLDYQNRIDQYVENFFKVVNWNSVGKGLVEIDNEPGL